MRLITTLRCLQGGIYNSLATSGSPLNDLTKDCPPALSGGGLETSEGHRGTDVAFGCWDREHPTPSSATPPLISRPAQARRGLLVLSLLKSLFPNTQPSGRGWDMASISPSSGVLPASSRAPHWVLHLLCVLDGFSWLWPILAPGPSVIFAQNLQATANSSNGNLRPTPRH